MSEKWNLNDVFASLDEAIGVGKKTLARCQSFRKEYEGKVASLEPMAFQYCLIQYSNTCTLLCLTESYAYLVWSTNLNEKAVCAFYQNMQDTIKQCEKELTFLEVEICKDIDYEKIASYLDNDEIGLGLKARLKKCLKFKPHTLSNDLEQLFCDQQSVADYWVRLYNEERAKFSIEVRGKKYNEGELMQLYNSQDATLRAEAEAKRMAWYEPRQELFASIYNALLRHWRHYAYALLYA